ncbi:hypothetical protein TNIN_481811 [Trichonephila inaurata madagascariensis]|uniref:Uncharacterized protein n=1 Tax=Trichonephila inaurata madagascariensis TaxID=2747483 RepID=A0A8X6WZT8_9ARAC|nr:hypothetical protein TNIN_481811 [Trichonephila inaurata madagascariensis]
MSIARCEQSGAPHGTATCAASLRRAQTAGSGDSEGNTAARSRTPTSETVCGAALRAAAEQADCRTARARNGAGLGCKRAGAEQEGNTRLRDFETTATACASLRVLLAGTGGAARWAARLLPRCFSEVTGVWLCGARAGAVGLRGRRCA